MKYILYARKSTEEDDRQILSIEAQLVELQEYAAKEKLEIDRKCLYNFILLTSFYELKSFQFDKQKLRAIRIIDWLKL